MNSFNINFKNYIKYNQLRKCFKDKKAPHFKKILMILLDKYLKAYSVNHCLTSKRMEKRAVKNAFGGNKNAQKINFNL